jgi:hypothetical protein
MNKSKEFPYSEVRDSRGDTILRPLLPLELDYRNKKLEVRGLLDSGADINVLPYQLGLDLGANSDESQTALRLSGNLANFEARGLLLNATVADQAPVRLAFAWTKAENVPLILGQVNFFLEFDVCFFRSKGIFQVGQKSAK